MAKTMKTTAEKRLAREVLALYVPHRYGTRRVAWHLGVTRDFVRRVVENEQARAAERAKRERERRERERLKRQISMSERQARDLQNQKDETWSEVMLYAEAVSPRVAHRVAEWLTRAMNNPAGWWRARLQWSIERWYQEALRREAA